MKDHWTRKFDMNNVIQFVQWVSMMDKYTRRIGFRAFILVHEFIYWDNGMNTLEMDNENFRNFGEQYQIFICFTDWNF